LYEQINKTRTEIRFLKQSGPNAEAEAYREALEREFRIQNPTGQQIIQRIENTAKTILTGQKTMAKTQVDPVGPSPNTKPFIIED